MVWGLTYAVVEEEGAIFLVAAPSSGADVLAHGEGTGEGTEDESGVRL